MTSISGFIDGILDGTIPPEEQNKYLKELLPPEISRDKIQEAVTTAYPNGYTQKEMGKVIKEIKVYTEDYHLNKI